MSNKVVGVFTSEFIKFEKLIYSNQKKIEADLKFFP